MYNELVFYLEACESGSMFNNILPNNTLIFSTTAANISQSSYAYYYTYMADEYSIRWMQDTTNNWNNNKIFKFNKESLIKQYNNVVNMVKESQPQKYGDYSFENEPIDYFQGYDDKRRNYYNRNYILNILKNSINIK